MKYVVVNNPIHFISYDTIEFIGKNNNHISVKRKFNNRIIWKLGKNGILILKNYADIHNLVY